jgi:hypothetical protein
LQLARSIGSVDQYAEFLETTRQMAASNQDYIQNIQFETSLPNKLFQLFRYSSALISTNFPMPRQQSYNRILATEREVCSNVVEIFAFSLLLVIGLNLTFNLNKGKQL